jgi:hypothetical protein
LDDLVRPILHLLVLLQNLGFCGCEDTIEAPHHGQRQYHLAVLVSFVRSSKEVADAPDEGGELLVRLYSHGALASGDSAEAHRGVAKNDFRAFAVQSSYCAELQGQQENEVNTLNDVLGCLCVEDN